MSNDSENEVAGEEAAEEVVSPAMRRRLQKCFEHGSSLVAQDKYDHDYVNTLFSECAINDPSNLIYVEAFLDNLQAKFGNNKKGGRAGSRGAFKKALAKEQWRDVLRLGPEILKGNPWDVSTLRGMAQACEALSYNEVELRYLKNSLDANPKDAEVNRHCARSLSRMGQFDQAIACWHRVEEIKKGDKEAPKMISQLTTEKAREHAGLGPERPKSTPAKPTTKKSPPPADSDDADPQPQPAKRREIQLTERQKLERAIDNDPAETSNYRKLADVLVDQQRFGDAERVLSKALNVAGKELSLLERLEDVQIERARNQVAIAEQRAGIEQTDEARSLVEQMQADLARREIEVFGNRADRYPDDRHVRFNLAVRLRRAGNYAEAIKYYQEARDEAGLKAQATLEMGECLQRLKQFAKALQCYARAAEVAENDPGCQKLALYRAGVLASGMKEAESAQKYLTALLELDPAYKDARARLDKIADIRHKG